VNQLTLGRPGGIVLSGWYESYGLMTNLLLLSGRGEIGYQWHYVVTDQLLLNAEFTATGR